jgi:PAS domain S-box-containing protein
VLTAALVERYFGAPFSLDRLRNVLGLLGAAAIAAATSGIGGAIGFAAFHDATASIFGTWRNWFASDGLGIVTVAPLIIGVAAAVRRPPPRSQVVEGLVALATLIVMSVIVIALPADSWTTVVPIALLFPILLWIAARCSPLFAAAATFIVTLAIVWTTTIGIGHFGSPGLAMADRVFAARTGILAVALCAFVLAALFAERREHEAALEESEARLQEALTAGAVTTFVWDADANTSQRSANAAEVLGFDPQRPFGSNSFLARVHCDDRERFKALVRGVSPQRPSYDITFRFAHGDGRDIWLEETAKAEFDAWDRLVRLKGLTLDVTTRKQSEDHQNSLIAALDQRVRNLLARVAAVAKDGHRSSRSLDEYAQALDRRIQSMADVHGLLSANRWDGTDLAILVRNQLARHATDANAAIGGPNTALTVGATQTLAAVLHELVTNAAKYGALSTPHGRVEVTWRNNSRAVLPNLSIVWREFGGPPVSPSPEYRYGVGVIRDHIPRELGGSVELAFLPAGVCCKIDIPLDTCVIKAQEPQSSRSLA